jgi:putative Holliday junction resolvase
MRAESGPVFAFDFGAKRIGVAVGDCAIGIAHPLQQIAFEDNRRRFAAIAKLVDEWRPVRFVVGIPGSDTAADHAMATQARRFARRLQSRFALPVDLVDEHLTSWEASRALSRTGTRAREQKPHLDQLAACLILESWFEAKRSGTHTTP